jgi:hypothetical protein
VKRTTLLLLTAIYLLSLVGIGFNRVYCCGKLTSVTLTYAMPDNAGNKTAQKDNCCKHEKRSFKVNDSHVAANSFVFDELSAAIIPTQYSRAWIVINTEQVSRINYQPNAPPGDPDIPIYTLNCAYRI